MTYKKSFWHSIGGILSGIAAILTAVVFTVTTVIGLLSDSDDSVKVNVILPNPEPSPKPSDITESTPETQAFEMPSVVYIPTHLDAEYGNTIDVSFGFSETQDSCNSQIHNSSDNWSCRVYDLDERIYCYITEEYGMTCFNAEKGCNFERSIVATVTEEITECIDTTVFKAWLTLVANQCGTTDEPAICEALRSEGIL